MLGLGKYGRSLAEALYQLGTEVLVADIDEETILTRRTVIGKATVANQEVG